MKYPSPDYFALALGEALQSLFLAIPVMVLVCALGGAIPILVMEGFMDDWESWLEVMLAWIAHWAVAGMMIWGVGPLAVEAWCLSQLLEGSRQPLLVLGVAFVAQLIVSTPVSMMFADSDLRGRAILVSGGIIILVVGLCWRASRKGKL